LKQCGNSWPSAFSARAYGKPKEVTKMTSQPSKEVVRYWLQQRRTASDPPPDIAEIRRQLGWGLVEKMQELINLKVEYQRDRTCPG
jgi:hypothetical protein